jgi:choline dehydrogenase-like flavoprotein
MPSADSVYDYVVVGAGPAGCLLANRLSADPACRVLLLEAGGRDNYPWIHIPVGYLYCIGNPRTDWCFKTEAQPGLNGRALGYPRGKVLGGCSSINGMIYMRGQAADYDRWAEQGNDGWAWKDVLPLFKQSENHFAGASDSHGADGEWRVERSATAGRSSMPSAMPPSRAASARSTTSTPATTKAVDTFRSTSAAVCAGTRPRLSQAHPQTPQPDRADRRRGRPGAAQQHPRPGGESALARRVA